MTSVCSFYLVFWHHCKKGIKAKVTVSSDKSLLLVKQHSYKITDGHAQLLLVIPEKKLCILLGANTFRKRHTADSMTTTISSSQASLLISIQSHMQLFPIAYLSIFRGSTSLYEPIQHSHLLKIRQLFSFCSLSLYTNL